MSSIQGSDLAVPTTTLAGPVVYGVVGEFAGPDALLEAAGRVREEGYRQFDVHTPFPVHGMDRAMGLGRSKLGWIVLISALSGAVVAMMMQWYCNAYDYPLITQGKPYFSWPAFLIITFELTVLFGAFGAVMGMIALNGLPQWYHPTLKYERFLRFSNDRFLLVIEAADEKFEPTRTAAFLTDIGASHVTALEE
jgi:hypothetical protein